MENNMLNDVNQTEAEKFNRQIRIWTKVNVFANLAILIGLSLVFVLQTVYKYAEFDSIVFFSLCVCLCVLEVVSLVLMIISWFKLRRLKIVIEQYEDEKPLPPEEDKTDSD